jgi:flavin-binding protein dodecin
MDQIQTLKTEIESLKADQQKGKHYLRAEIWATADALVQSQAVLAESHSSVVESQPALADSQAANDALKRAQNTIHARHTFELWNSTSDRQSQHSWRVCQVVSSPLQFHSSSVNLTNCSPGTAGPPRPLCCSAVRRMCNRREIPRVDTEYQL